MNMFRSTFAKVAVVSILIIVFIVILGAGLLYRS